MNESYSFPELVLSVQLKLAHKDFREVNAGG
jgi:hypothetical protein